MGAGVGPPTRIVGSRQDERIATSAALGNSRTPISRDPLIKSVDEAANSLRPAIDRGGVQGLLHAVLPDWGVWPARLHGRLLCGQEFGAQRGT